MNTRYFLVTTVVGLLCSPVGADDWPQFLGPQRNGVSKETGLVSSFPKEGPPLAWEKEVGHAYSGPVVAGDRVIVFHRVGDEEVVECLSAVKGDRHWRFAYACAYQDGLGKGDGPRATPAIAGRRVITLGVEGRLHCLDLERGKKIWSRDLGDYKIPPSYFGAGSSPVVEDGLVLVNVGGKEAGIVAFKLQDGAEKWRATKDGASYASPTVGTIDNVRHAVFFTREGVVVLDPKTGDVRHRQRFRATIDASVNAATPLLIGDQAFFSACYETGALLLRLKKNGAEEVWTSEDAMSNHYNTCVYHDGCLYGFDGRQEEKASFRCLDLKTRKVMWNQDRYGCGSMVLADGQIFIVTERGELVLVEATPKEYKERARARVLDNLPVRAQIALANGRLYARDGKKLASWNVKK